MNTLSRWLCAIAMIALCAPMWAADVTTTPVIAPDSTSTGWQAIVMMVLTAIVIPFVANYLKKHAEAADAAAKVSGLTAKQKIAERVEAYIFTVAAQFTEKQLPEIAQAVVAGQLKTKEQITERLRGLGIMLKAQAIDYFKTQDIDLLVEIGESQLDIWIRSAADKLNPFIGQGTAEALLRGGAQFIVNFGVEKAKQAIFTAGIQTQMNVPAAAPAAPPAAPATPAAPAPAPAG